VPWTSHTINDNAEVIKWDKGAIKKPIPTKKKPHRGKELSSEAIRNQVNENSNEAQKHKVVSFKIKNEDDSGQEVATSQPIILHVTDGQGQFPDSTSTNNSKTEKRDAAVVKLNAFDGEVQWINNGSSPPEEDRLASRGYRGTRGHHFTVTYWSFFPYNRGKNVCTSNMWLVGRVAKPLFKGRCLGQNIVMGNHVGDWEHVSIFFEVNIFV